MNFYEWMREHRMVAILRGIRDRDLMPAAEALFAGGVRLLEVTMNTSGAADKIFRLRERFNGSMLIGAGTVTDLRIAEEAVRAGSQFLISSNFDEAVVQFGSEQGALPLPGAMTPTEIVQAHRAGAGMVKLFPARLLGPAYVKELQGPLSHIPLVAVGGVNAGNAADYLRAGAIGVGVGGALFDRQAIEAGDYDKLTKHAESMVQALR